MFTTGLGMVDTPVLYKFKNVKPETTAVDIGNHTFGQYTMNSQGQVFRVDDAAHAFIIYRVTDKNEARKAWLIYSPITF